MRSIVALGTIGILLFATTSCEKKEEEPPVFEPQTRVLYVYKTDTDGYLLKGWNMYQIPSVVVFYTPVYLPEAYKRLGLQVNVTFRQIAGARGNHPVVEILEIEERILTSRFFVEYHFSCGLMLQDWLPPHSHVGRLNRVVRNLPEEYRRSGLDVYVTFRAYRMFLGQECDYVNVSPSALEIIDIRSVVYSSRFYVRYTHKFGHYGYLLVEDLGDSEPRVLYPVNLPEEYQQEGLNVNVTYRRLWRDLIVCREYRRNCIPTIEILSVMETPEERAATRIIGGERDFIRNHPWLVLITQYMGNNRYYFLCAGSIIAPNLILTARHCVFVPYTATPRFSESDIRIHVGITCRSEIAPENTFAVHEFIPYRDTNVDAALLRVLVLRE